MEKSFSITSKTICFCSSGKRAIQQQNGEITDKERQEQDEKLGVGGFNIQLISNYSCSAKVEAYCE